MVPPLQSVQVQFPEPILAHKHLQFQLHKDLTPLAYTGTCIYEHIYTDTCAHSCTHMCAHTPYMVETLAHIHVDAYTDTTDMLANTHGQRHTFTHTLRDSHPTLHTHIHTQQRHQHTHTHVHTDADTTDMLAHAHMDRDIYIHIH